MPVPLAFLLTWTCYGQWLHGDARGSVDREHRTPGGPLCRSSVRRRTAVRQQMRGEPYLLTPEGRRIVEEAIEDHCRHRRWWLGAVNARTNHVHCVVGAPGVSPEEVVQQLKSWSTRRLRQRDLAPRDASPWTRHASTKSLWNRSSVEQAALYVAEMQDSPHKRPAPQLE